MHPFWPRQTLGVDNTILQCSSNFISTPDYIERFELNHLASYSHAIYPYFYLTHFVMGLRVDIRALLLTRWPPDMNTACLLALLQDEVVDAKHHPHTQSSRSREADATLWPGSPPCLLPAQIPTPAADRCSVEGARADSPKSRHSDTIGARLMLQVRRTLGTQSCVPHIRAAPRCGGTPGTLRHRRQHRLLFYDTNN